MGCPVNSSFQKSSCCLRQISWPVRGSHNQPHSALLQYLWFQTLPQHSHGAVAGGFLGYRVLYGEESRWCSSSEILKMEDAWIQNESLVYSRIWELFQTGSLPLLLLLELIFFHETTSFPKLHNEPFLCFHVLEVQLSSDKIASFLSSAFDQVQTCSCIRSWSAFLLQLCCHLPICRSLQSLHCTKLLLCAARLDLVSFPRAAE